jgi:sugar phosphate isomerase/epimerase
MNYTMMTYTMSRYPDFDFKKTVEFSKEIGLKHIDICFLGGPIKFSAAEAKKICDDSGLKVACNTFGLDINGKDMTLEKWLETLKQKTEDTVGLGSANMMIPTPPAQGMSASQNRANWIRALSRGVELAKNAGLRLSVEHFPGETSPFLTSSDMLEAIKEVPDLRVTYDNGNCSEGEDPAEGFRRVAKYVIHSHFKGRYISDTEKEGFRKMKNGKWCSSALIGEDDIDHKACLRAMKENGYADGTVNIEYEGNKYNGYDAVRKAVDYLRAAEKAL